MENLSVTKICTVCSSTRNISDFYKDNSRRDIQFRSECRFCQSRRNSVAGKIKRKNPKYRSYFILIDSKYTDTAAKRDNNLTKDLISHLISLGCIYCKNKTRKMTLDRIDNSKGHTLENVLPCCVLCNIIKSDMPFKLWLEFTEVLVKLEVEGKLISWPSKMNRY